MPAKPQKDNAISADGERIAKRMARSGLCSRREAERWIEAGRVKINNETLTTPACTVTDKDIILVDGKPLPDQEPPRLWRYNKPAGLITTHKDPEGRQTVFDTLPNDMPRVISVGRLDFNSEGLLLLTNDGALAQALAHPKTGWVRRYRVRVFGTPSPAALAKLAKGMTVEGTHYGPIHAEVERAGTNSWLVVSLKEGKNREIRKVFESIGHPVSRLIRVAYGAFQLGKLRAGDIDEVSGKILKEQCGRWL